MNYTSQQLKDIILSMDISSSYANRIHRLQEYLALSGLDAAICMQPQNVVYLSGFNPILFSHPIAVIVPRNDPPILLTHCLRGNHARHESVIKDLQLYGMWGCEIPIADDFYSALQAIFRKRGLRCRHIGYEGEFLPVSTYRKIVDALDTAECINISPDLIRARMIKDSYECALIRLAARVGEVGIAAAQKHLLESEADSSIAAEIAMRKFWAEELSCFEVCGSGNAEGGIISTLWCYCNNGKKTAFGCESPGPTVPQPGTISLPSVWACIRGYYAEMERAECIGALPPYYARAYETVSQARRIALESAKAGVVVGDLYRKATQVYIENGFEDLLPGRIGHGLGLSIHEQPSVEKGSPLVLQEGMVITIEPGLMFPGWGAIRHSDTVIIHADGVEVLTHDSKES